MTAPTTSPVASPRRPWVAALFALLTPGLGQLYAGRGTRAIVVWLLCGIAAILSIALMVMARSRTGLIAIILLLLVAPVLQIVDAARVARAAPVPFVRRWYNHWLVYASIALLAVFAWQPVFLSWAKTNLAHAYRLPSDSMAPTLLEGDYILTVPLRGSVDRGEIVVHRANRQTYVKRVVGLPGDTLAMHDGMLSVNGRPQPESYAQDAQDDPSWPEFAWQRQFLLRRGAGADYRPSLRNWGPLVMPPRQYFLLGDNRGNSLDSRFHGFVVRDSLIGQPTSIYFSRDATTREIRWGRVGRAIE